LSTTCAPCFPSWSVICPQIYTSMYWYTAKENSQNTNSPYITYYKMSEKLLQTDFYNIWWCMLHMPLHFLQVLEYTESVPLVRSCVYTTNSKKVCYLTAYQRSISIPATIRCEYSVVFQHLYTPQLSSIGLTGEVTTSN
jgi:hypothetical protein